MWGLDPKKGWAPKNWCFWTVVLDNTLESPWTARRSNQSILKEINSEHSLEGLTLKRQYFSHLLRRASSVQFSSVIQSCPTLWDPMNHSTPGLPVHHQHHYSNSCPLSRWCHPTISSSVVPFSSLLQSFPESGSFQMSQFFTSGGQSIGVSLSASVLPMNVQDWFPLGLTGWISLQSKGLSRIFSNTTVQKQHSLALSNSIDDLICKAEIKTQCTEQMYGYLGERVGQIGGLGLTYTHY